MKPLKLLYTAEARRLIRKLHPEIKQAIRCLIQEIFENPTQGKALKGALLPFRSSRYSRYRVIYEYDVPNNCLIIHYVGRRKNIYALFEAFVRSYSAKDLTR